MTWRVVICVVKNRKEPVKKEWLRIGTTRAFGGLRVSGKYCAWSAWGKSFMGGWVKGKRKCGESMRGGGMFKIT